MVSSDGDVCSVRVCLVGAYFSNHLYIGDFKFPIHRDVSVVNKIKDFRPPDTLVVWSISHFAYPLAQSSQFIGVQCIPDFLVLGMFPQLYVFKGLSRFFVSYRYCLVKEKFSWVPSA